MRLTEYERLARPQPLTRPLPIWTWVNSPRFQRGMELVLALVVGAAVGVLIAVGYAAVVFGLIGAMAFVGLGLRRPEYAILVMIGITSGLVDPEALPWLTMGPMTLHITDLLLFFLLGLIFLRATAQPGFKLVRTPLSWPLILFILAIVISVVNAIMFRGVAPNDVLRLARVFVYWLVFFGVVHLIRDEAALRRLLNGIWILAGILFLGTLAPNALEPLHLLPVRTTGIAEVSDAVTQGEEIRLYTYGERMFFVLIPTLASLIAIDKRRRPWAVLLLVAMFIWLFRSFQRNYLLTTMLNLGLLFMLVPSLQSLRFVKRMGPVLLVGVALLVGVLLAQPEQIRRQVGAWEARFESMLGGSGQVDPNLEYRLVENHYALQEIRENPVFGIGLRNNYRPLMRYEMPDTALTWYMHNAYLWILTMMGIVGLIPFVWLCAAFLVRTFRHYREIQNDELRAIYLGFGVAFVGTLISNLVAPNFLQHWSLIIYPTMIGVNEVIYRLATEEQAAV